MVFTQNNLPNIKNDSGTERRIDAFTTTSTFTKEQSEVNESKHIYLANRDFLQQVGNDDKYLNAFVGILLEYGYNWLSKVTVYKQTPNFRDTKDEIVVSNDIIQDFIDQHLTNTNNDNDRIGRDEMYESFKSAFPKSIITPTQLLNSLKQKDIIYSASYRYNNLRGCYSGIKFGCDETVKVKSSPLDHGIGYDFGKIKDIDYKTELQVALNRIAELEALLAPKMEAIEEPKVSQEDLDNFFNILENVPKKEKKVKTNKSKENLTLEI
jgi:hypothetical protein